MHRSRIQARIKAKLHKLSRADLAEDLQDGTSYELEAEPIIYVHLCASVVGGTGAGCILPFAFDIQQWCVDEVGPAAIVVAHLVLPGAFRVNEPETVRRLRTTGLATLSQINHFMGTGAETMLYKEAAVVWPKERSPLRLCFLLDGKSGTNTEDVETVCNNAARMIAVLTTEAAGEQLIDNWDNLELDEVGDDDTDNRCFSSYEVRAVTRPYGQTIGLICREACRQLADSEATEHTQTPTVASPLEDLFRRLRARDELSQQMTSGFRKMYDDLVGSDVNRSEDVRGLPAQGNPSAERFRKEVEDFKGQAADLAEQLVRGQVSAWRDGRKDDDLIREILRKWRESSEPAVGLQRFLQQMLSQLKTAPSLTEDRAVSPKQVEDELIRFFRKDSNDLWISKTRERVRNLVVHLAEAHLLAEATRAVESARSTLFGLVGRLLDRARQLASACEEQREQLWSPKVTAERADGVLYQLDESVLEAPTIREQYGGLAKRMAEELLAVERPAVGYLAAMRSVFLHSSEIQRTLRQTTNECFRLYEKQCASEDAHSSRVEQFKESIARASRAASPRWQPSTAIDVLEDNIVAYPSEIKALRRIEELSDEEFVGVEDAKCCDVTIIKTAHGAALSDLENLAGWDEDFQRTVEQKRRRAKRKRAREFREQDMWLDPAWPIRRPRLQRRVEERKASRQHVCFALLFAEDRLKPHGTGFVLYDADFERAEELGETLPQAFEKWSASASAEADCRRLLSRPLEQLVKTAEVAAERLSETLGDLNWGDSDERRMTREFDEALDRQLRQWRNNLKLHGKTSEPATPG
jgi:hypothetical protein